LSIVHAIVADHQGVVHVMSKPGQDTTFVLIFPPADVEFASA
jgi:signal transduction histidine kinase